MAQTITAAMHEVGVSRLIFTSAMGLVLINGPRLVNAAVANDPLLTSNCCRALKEQLSLVS